MARACAKLQLSCVFVALFSVLEGLSFSHTLVTLPLQQAPRLAEIQLSQSYKSHTTHRHASKSHNDRRWYINFMDGMAVV